MKDCPFCGRDGIPPHPLMLIEGTWCCHFIQCPRCLGQGPRARSQPLACEAWNERAPTSQQPRTEGFEDGQPSSITEAFGVLFGNSIRRKDHEVS